MRTISELLLTFLLNAFWQIALVKGRGRSANKRPGNKPNSLDRRRSRWSRRFKLPSAINRERSSSAG